MNEALLVAVGAVPGAWLRVLLVEKLEPHLPRRHWGTLGVTLGACFALGVLLGVTPHLERGSPLPLLIGTGFLGSLSTFSTLMAEVLAMLRLRQWGETALLTSGAILGGLLALGAGRLLAS